LRGPTKTGAVRPARWQATSWRSAARRVKLALVPYVFLVYGTAAVLADLLVVGRGVQAFGFAPETYLWLVLLALIPQLIGHSSFNWALRHAPATLATVPVLGEPVGATILAALVLGQVPTVLTLAGGALVLAGVFMVTFCGARDVRASEINTP
jgi:drug/metabolite transporter (DMT)-like permease